MPQGGGARFVLDDGRAGILVPKGDRAALAQAMTALADPATRRRYAALAAARAACFAPEPAGAALLRADREGARARGAPVRG